ncbi:hypothetical protein PSAL_020710 [Pseudooceanicola algae]|uniref:Uncharacterized protein n=1 Tax=Pseudooceanicola algae TaxID=1537215 RepID=A0A418SLE0_9RHOB|nr:hypothetical protein PSAL_020710 [Pseudooceanicola algae]
MPSSDTFPLIQPKPRKQAGARTLRIVEAIRAGHTAQWATLFEGSPAVTLLARST